MNTESYLIRFLFMLYFSYAFQELVYPWSLQSRIVQKRYSKHSLLLRCVHNCLSLPLFLLSSVVPCNNSLDTCPCHSCHKPSNAFWKSMWLWERSCWWSIYFSIISLMLAHVRQCFVSVKGMPVLCVRCSSAFHRILLSTTLRKTLV